MTIFLSAIIAICFGFCIIGIIDFTKEYPKTMVFTLILIFAIFFTWGKLNGY